MGDNRFTVLCKTVKWLSPIVTKELSWVRRLSGLPLFPVVFVF